MNICVYGASSDRIDPQYKEAAFKLGQAIAKEGWGMVFGAGTTGLMGAAVRGAQSENGHTIGVTPHFFDELGVVHKSVDELIWTDTMRIRKETMENKSDSFVVLPGGIGTFEEFFEVLTLKQLKQHKKPIVLYNVAHYYDPMLNLLQATIDHGFMSKETMELIYVADNLDDVLYHLKHYSMPDIDIDYQVDVPYQR